MSVFSKVKGFFSRHRNKFLVGGLLITGSVFLARFAQNRLREWHEKEAMEFIERSRKQSHFESINRTCNQTVVNLSSSLLDRIYHSVNVDETLEKLRNNPENKVELWNSLKRQVFTKAGAIIYALVMLVITLKLQLNILGGYLYKDPNSVPAEVQEKYLSLCQHFLNTGVEKLVKIVDFEVNKLVEHIALNKSMKLSDLEAIFWSLQSGLDAHPDNPVNHLRQYICNDPPSAEDVYSSMLRDTADLLESEEIKFLVIHNINTGFVLLGDQLSDFFTNNRPKIMEISANGEFENPYKTKKFFANLVPVLNGLLAKQSFPHNFTHHLISNDKLHTLCANVYESLLG